MAFNNTRITGTQARHGDFWRLRACRNTHRSTERMDVPSAWRMQKEMTRQFRNKMDNLVWHAHLPASTTRSVAFPLPEWPKKSCFNIHWYISTSPSSLLSEPRPYNRGFCFANFRCGTLALFSCFYVASPISMLCWRLGTTLPSNKSSQSKSERHSSISGCHWDGSDCAKNGKYRNLLLPLQEQPHGRDRETCSTRN